MASSSQAVTPEGIRDGDATALAALVEHRANAVLVYCEAVCAPAGVERAAAEAFARFRAAVAAAEDPRSLDPGTLLLGATRHAAASMTIIPTSPADGGLRRKLAAGRGSGASETCALIPGLLAARAEGALSSADRERLARHLERHPPCRALADAADRAEAAYASPPPRMVPIGALTEIMLALTAAAPITAAPGPELDFAEVSFAETAPESEAESKPAEQDPDPPSGEQRTEPEIVAEPQYGELPTEPEIVVEPPHGEPQTEPEIVVEPPHGEPPTEPEIVVEPPHGEPPTEPELQAGPQYGESQTNAAQTEPPPVAALTPETMPPVLPAVVMDEVDAPPRADPNHTVVLPPTAAIALPTTAVGVAHPRPTRRHLHLLSHGVLYRYVLPGAFIAAALLAAMGVAGVFSSDERPPAAAVPATTGAPVAPPVDAPPVVPPKTGVAAAERAALAAERRTRRQRAAAAKRRRALVAAKAAPSTTQTETTPPAATDPDPAPPPTPAPTPTQRRAPRQTSTAEKEPPAASSSALPDTGSATTPSADPGVFEGTPPPAP